jgi:ATP-dependent DNA helicase RecG
MDFKETETLELKKSTSEKKEAVISIASILNKHRKGDLYFGVKNDGVVVGQVIGDDTLRDVSQAVSEGIEPKIYPEIKKVKIEGKECIHVSFHGGNSVYYAFGRAYVRVGDENRQLSSAEIEKLILERNREKHRWEDQSSEYGLDKIQIEALKAYVKEANAAGRIGFKFTDAKSTLTKLGLLRSGRLLRAAEVLFCDENPLKIQLAVFAGVDKVTFLDLQQYTGSIFTLLEKSEAYIREHINWRVEFGKLRRNEVPEVPLEAVREALVNSLCHRDYAAPESNNIAIFKDRIEIAVLRNSQSLSMIT